MRWYCGGLDDRDTLYLRQRPWVASEMREQLFLGEEDRCIAFLARPAQLDAEQASVELIVNVPCRQVALGQAQSKADAGRVMSRRV